MPRIIPEMTIMVRLKGKRKFAKVEVFKSKQDAPPGIGGKCGINLKMPGGKGKGHMIIDKNGKPTDFKKHELRDIIWNGIKQKVFEI